MASCTITLPCQVGDEVWGIRKYNGGKYNEVVKLKRGFVTQMYFIESMRLCICVKHVCRGEWGKDIFPTMEAAQAYLEGGTSA